MSQSDSNLYNACLNFPADTNVSPDLQISYYGNNSVLIKANHFDYSSETRDFALLVCDSPDKPTWKNIDLSGSSDSQDGWLVQGTVPAWQVSDPMYFLIGNTPTNDNAFFQAIPYTGAVISFSGPATNDVVSNTISMQVVIMDLSGVTNEQFSLDVDQLPARYSLGSSNTITVETQYNPNGLHNADASVFCDNTRVYDTNNIPDNAKLSFTGTSSIPLDFENSTYLLFASDNCSTNVGTNYILFVISEAQNISISITDPSNSSVVYSFSGYVPYAATVEVPWNFTESDGVTPYSNDTYVVNFTASDPAALAFTNGIERVGIRPGASCLMTYEWEDPSTTTGLYLNTRAYNAIDSDLTFLYGDLYDPFGFTQYNPGDVGDGRAGPLCLPFTILGISWDPILSNLTNSYISEFDVAQAHGSGGTIGGGNFLPYRFSPQDLKRWVTKYPDGHHWRLRKSALFACYSGTTNVLGTAGVYSSFVDACGITENQFNNYSHKNCGLFFGGLLPQGPYGVSHGNNDVTADVAEFLDQAWVCGKYQFPGGCDPTYSFKFALFSMARYYPELQPAIPLGFGYVECIYSSVYDEELMKLNTTHVNDN